VTIKSSQLWGKEGLLQERCTKRGRLETTRSDPREAFGTIDSEKRENRAEKTIHLPVIKEKKTHGRTYFRRIDRQDAHNRWYILK